MENLEHIILDSIQDDFPLVDRPYLELGRIFHLSEEKIFAIISNLRRNGFIRRIGGIYDSKKLGYISRLCAGVISTDKLTKFENATKKIPAITHNYIRNHYYNVWFTIIAKTPLEIEHIVNALQENTGLKNVKILSSKKMFKINTVMKHFQATNLKKIIPDTQEIKVNFFSENDKRRINLLSQDLPYSLTPYAVMKVPVEEIKMDLHFRYMRRFGAVLRHQNAGFSANAMVCFSVNDVEKAGILSSQYSSISHCYEREPFENFPYNLYAMFYAQDEYNLNQQIQEFVKKIAPAHYVVLNSVKELKKTSFIYFNE